ncbi:unnamed protein product [Blepharisma stoltei]|uniref:Uncharacterized protein n=1 Tax=Blepharisma stoltei TaxID=1481888 RepID=A0AAU9KBV2_9CILI|nr:unnamed protein product [Blepharisma stoltei]
MDSENHDHVKRQLGDLYSFNFSNIILIRENWEIIFCYIKLAIIHRLHNCNIFSPNVWEFLRTNEIECSSGENIDYQYSEQNYQIIKKRYSSPCEELMSLCNRDRDRNQINKEDYKEILKEIANWCLKNIYENSQPLAIFRAFYKYLGIGFGLISIADSITQMDFFEFHEAICVFAIFNQSIYNLIPSTSSTNEFLKSLFKEKLVSHIDEKIIDKKSQILLHCGCRFDIFDIKDLTRNCKCNEKLYEFEIDLIKKLKKEYDLCNQKNKAKKKNRSCYEYNVYGNEFLLLWIWRP